MTTRNDLYRCEVCRTNVALEGGYTMRTPDGGARARCSQHPPSQDEIHGTPEHERAAHAEPAP